MTNSFTNVFTGNPVQPATVSYKAFSLTGNIQLSWPTQLQDTGDVVAQITEIAVNNNGYLVFLPSAKDASVGQSITFVNTSSTSKTFDIVTYTAANLVTLSTGESVIIYLLDNSTDAGSWRIIPFGGGFSGVSSVAATNGTDGISITGSPITAAGTLTFSLEDNLVALSNLSTTGLVVQDSLGSLITRDIVGGLNIDVDDGDGVGANPTVNLSDTLTGMSSITVGNFNLTNNILSTTGGNTDIKIVPNGTGSVLLGSGLTPPTVSAAGILSNVDILDVTTSAQIGKVAMVSTTVTSTDATGNLTVAAAGTGSLTLKGNSGSNALVIDQNNNITHKAVPKAWVLFNGGTGAIVDSYNVTSVSRTGTGEYTITVPGTLFTTRLIPMANSYINSGDALVNNVKPTSLTTLTFSVNDTANASTDPTEASLVVMGY